MPIGELSSVNWGDLYDPNYRPPGGGHLKLASLRFMVKMERLYPPHTLSIQEMATNVVNDIWKEAASHQNVPLQNVRGDFLRRKESGGKDKRWWASAAFEMRDKAMMVMKPSPQRVEALRSRLLQLGATEGQVSSLMMGWKIMRRRALLVAGKASLRKFLEELGWNTETTRRIMSWPLDKQGRVAATAIALVVGGKTPNMDQALNELRAAPLKILPHPLNQPSDFKIPSWLAKQHVASYEALKLFRHVRKDSPLLRGMPSPEKHPRKNSAWWKSMDHTVHTAMSLFVDNRLFFEGLGITEGEAYRCRAAALEKVHPHYHILSAHRAYYVRVAEDPVYSQAIPRRFAARNTLLLKGVGDIFHYMEALEAYLDSEAFRDILREMRRTEDEEAYLRDLRQKEAIDRIPDTYLSPRGRIKKLLPQDLEGEGKRMAHCVGTEYYADRVVEKLCSILHLSLPSGEEATLEVVYYGGDYKKTQLHGPHNSNPSEEMTRLAGELLISLQERRDN